VAQSFCYLAFIRVLQLIGLLRRDRHELAIEMLALRHEVHVLQRQNLWVPNLCSDQSANVQQEFSGATLPEHVDIDSHPLDSDRTRTPVVALNEP
jgi:hypothetical protein